MVRPVLQEAILEALQYVGPMRNAELAAHTGRSEHVVWEAVFRMRAKGMVHISGWARAAGTKGGRRSAIYAYGSKPDVPEPPADDATARNQRYRKNNAAVLRARGAVRRRKSGAQPKGLGADNIWKGLVR